MDSRLVVWFGVAGQPYSMVMSGMQVESQELARPVFAGPTFFACNVLYHAERRLGLDASRAVSSIIYREYLNRSAISANAMLHVPVPSRRLFSQWLIILSIMEWLACANGLSQPHSHNRF